MSPIAILIIGNKIENGDINAASMYLVVFALPTILLIVLNGLYLAVIRNIVSQPTKIVSSLLPPLILMILSFKEDLTFRGIDGNLVFVARVALGFVGITNLLWATLSTKQKGGLNKECV